MIDVSDPRSWNPWHGCRKYSEGCQNCYVYFLDDLRNVDIHSSEVRRTNEFDLPVRRDKYGVFKIPPGFVVSVNRTSDTFIEEADGWRNEMWGIIRSRPDVIFDVLTKRIPRMKECLPADWGDGYDNVLLNMTAENQRAFDERWPIFKDIPSRHKAINLAPLIGPVDISPALESGQIERVEICGEFYGGERPCRYGWIKDVSDACARYEVNLNVGPLGTVFIMNGIKMRFKYVQQMTDYAYKLKLSRFYGRPVYELYDPVDDHRLNGSEIPEPMFNLGKCRHCTRMQMCMGCVDCGNCKDVQFVDYDEMIRLRSQD